jgi:hypothetical protein
VKYRRVDPLIVIPEHRYGSLLVETIETLDPQDGTPVRHRYDVIRYEHITVDGQHESRIARIVPSTRSPAERTPS